MLCQTSSLRVAGLCRRASFNDRRILLGGTKAQCRLLSDSGKGKEEGSMYLVQAGLPLFLFCGLGVWVVSNGIDGKNRERDAFQGRSSKYVRKLETVEFSVSMITKPFFPLRLTNDSFKLNQRLQ